MSATCAQRFSRYSGRGTHAWQEMPVHTLLNVTHGAGRTDQSEIAGDSDSTSYECNRLDASRC
jgi:hypothetical protein